MFSMYKWEEMPCIIKRNKLTHLEHFIERSEMMAKFKHLTNKKLKHIKNQLWKVESSLEGLSALFQDREQQGAAPLDSDQLFGIGQILKGFSKELSILLDILSCGHDSKARTEKYFKGDWDRYDRY